MADLTEAEAREREKLIEWLENRVYHHKRGQNPVGFYSNYDAETMRVSAAYLRTEPQRLDEAWRRGWEAGRDAGARVAKHHFSDPNYHSFMQSASRSIAAAIASLTPPKEEDGDV